MHIITILGPSCFPITESSHTPVLLYLIMYTRHSQPEMKYVFMVNYLDIPRRKPLVCDNTLSR